MKFTKLVILLSIALLGLSACDGRNLTPTSWPGLAVDGDRLLVAFDAHIYAIDPTIDTTSTSRWKFPAEPENGVSFFSAPVMLEDGRWVAGAYNSVLYELNTTDNNAGAGWIFEGASNRYIGSPVVTAAGIFAPSADSQLYAIGLDGQQLWSPVEAEEPFWAQPATDGQTLFVPSLDHKLYAIDAGSGDLVWSNPVDLGGAILGTPAYDAESGLVLVGSFDEKMFAIDAASSVIAWTVPTNGWVWGGPTISDGVAYFGDIAGNLYAISAADGREVWTHVLDGAIHGTPLVYENAVYIGTETGHVYGFELEGGPTMAKTINGKIYGGPVAVANMIIFAILDGDHVLTGYDADGLVQFQWTLPED